MQENPEIDSKYEFIKFKLWILKLNGIEINSGIKKKPIKANNNWSYRLRLFEYFLPTKDNSNPIANEIAKQKKYDFRSNRKLKYNEYKIFNIEKKLITKE